MARRRVMDLDGYLEWQTVTVFRREHSATIRDFVCWWVGPLVGPHITLNIIFSAVCRQIDMTFGRVHVDFLFQFLLFFFLTNSFLSSFSLSSEITLIYK
jgi:hypothetical protein